MATDIVGMTQIRYSSGDDLEQIIDGRVLNRKNIFEQYPYNPIMHAACYDNAYSAHILTVECTYLSVFQRSDLSAPRIALAE